MKQIIVGTVHGWFACLILVITPLFCCGCESLLRDPYTAEVGSVSMTATCIGRWEDLRGQLAPQFDLKNGDKALPQVMPDTAMYQKKLLDARSLGLAASFPTAEAPPAVGDDGTFDSRTAAGLPGINDLLGDRQLGIDPVLRYQLANALFQEVQLLNEYITRTAIPEGYSPYVVRLFLRPDVNPWFDETDVDAYTTVSFFKDKGVGFVAGKTAESNPVVGGDDIRVLPLLVTDHIEAALTSQSIEELRRLAVVLSIANNKIGGSANYQSIVDNLESALARETNSLISVSRESENSIRVRLGGNNTTSARRVTTRNHPITLVVLVRNSKDELNARKKRLKGGSPEDLDGSSEIREGRKLRAASFTRFRLTRELDGPRAFSAPFRNASKDIVFTQVTPLSDYADLAKEAMLDALISRQRDFTRNPLSTAYNMFVREQVWEEIVKAINASRCCHDQLNSRQARYELLRIALLVADNKQSVFDRELRKITSKMRPGRTSRIKVNILTGDLGGPETINHVIWSTYVEMFGAMEYSHTFVSLPLLRRPRVERADTITHLVAQYAPFKETTILLEGEDLNAGNIRASLKIGGNDKVLIAAKKYLASHDGKQLLLTFDTGGIFASKDLKADTGELLMNWFNPEEVILDGPADGTTPTGWENITESNPGTGDGMLVRFVLREKSDPKAGAKKAPPAAPESLISALVVEPGKLLKGSDTVVRLKADKKFDPNTIAKLQLQVTVPAKFEGGSLAFAAVNGHHSDTLFSLAPALVNVKDASASFVLKNTLKPGDAVTFKLVVTPKKGKPYPVSAQVVFQSEK